MANFASFEKLVRLHGLLCGTPRTLVWLFETFEVSESTIRRMLKNLEAVITDPIQEAILDDGRKVFSLPRNSVPPQDYALRLSTAHLIALVIARNSAREMLRGTGFDDDLNDACARIMGTLKGADAARALDLERKIYDRGEMPVDHSSLADALNDITTALWNGEQLLLRRRDSKGAEVTHLFDPYSLVTYKKGLYLVGYSHDKAQRISLGLDMVLEATHQKGKAFVYPADYSQESMFKGAMGMFTGPMTRVHLRFDAKVARYVVRRKIHASQEIVATHPDKSIDVTLEIAGTTELESLLLSYGPLVEVRSPPALRETMKAALKRALATYEAPVDP